MNVYYIEEHRFYPLKDAGKGRQSVDVGDLVSFRFPHDDQASTGIIVKKYQSNGKTVYDLKKGTEL